MKLQLLALAGGRPAWPTLPATISLAERATRCCIKAIAIVIGLGLGSAPVFAALFATDNADNDPYPVTHFQLGDNGGYGFLAWVQLESGTPGSRSLAPAIVPLHVSAWGLGGTYGVGRGLASILPVGAWRLTAVHDPHNSGFSGFNLKASTQAGFGTDELLRFGFNGSGDTGIYVSTDGGANYTFLDCGWDNGSGDRLEYSVGWDAAGNYSLSVNNLTEAKSSSFTGTMAPGGVAMLGAVVYGTTLNEGLAFDAFEVETIPEPATVLPLLAVIVLTLVWWRRLPTVQKEQSF